MIGAVVDVRFDAGLPPTVQFGNMMRIDATRYHQQQESLLEAERGGPG